LRGRFEMPFKDDIIKPTPYRLFSALLTALVLLGACASPPTPPAPISSVLESAVRSVPAEAINPDVSQETIQQTICVVGYTATVRPSTSYTKGVKAKLLREQSLPIATASEYELDHRIPLALGGHPRNLANLALQLWEGDNGAKRKDQLERRLQRLVCADALRLDTARSAIYFDWRAAEVTYPAR
jgi:hypothetical protein